MNREIKFRGFSKEDNEWIYGNVMLPDKLLADVFICPSVSVFDFTAGEEFEKLDEYGEIIKKGCTIGRFKPVYKDSIGQYTGLKDKNGKEIYEWDIVSPINEQGFDHGIHKGEKFEVFFFVENGSWYIKRDYRYEENMGNIKSMYEMLANCYVEVIGNICENPELL